MPFAQKFFWRAALFFQLFVSSLLTFVPLYWVKIAVLKENIAIIDSLVFLFSFLAPIFVLLVCSRKNYKNLVVGFSIIGGLSAIAFGIVTDNDSKILHLAITTFSITVSTTLMPLSAIILLHDENFGKNYGDYRKFGSIGFLLGLTSGGVALDYFNIISLPLFLGTAFIISGIFFGLINFQSKEEMERIFPDRLVKSSGGLLNLDINSDQIILLAIFFVIQVIFWTSFCICFRYPGLRIVEMGYSSLYISQVMAFLGIVALLTISKVGEFSDRFSLKMLWYLIPIFLAIRTFSLGLPEKSGVWFFLIQLLHIPTWILNDVLVVKYLKKMKTTLGVLRVSSAIQLSTILGLSFGSYVMARLIAEYGLKQSFILASLIPLLSIPFILFMFTFEKHRFSLKESLEVI